jgi:acyl-coenzyme A synthetase/AMP-(fatty) acid ligase
LPDPHREEPSATFALLLRFYHWTAKRPAYSHPRFIDIVAALPLNGAGKIDRGVVQARLGAAYATSAADKQ